MNAIVETTTQRDVAWFAARTGKATASKFKDVLAKLKNGNSSEARNKYLIEIVVERLTGQSAQHFTNAAMQWGTDREAEANVSYCEKFNVEVDSTGFVRHPTIEAGASPDGLVDWDGLIEIKCPFNSANHIQTWLTGMPPEHMAQVQGQMWVTGRQWCDFVSFDPRMPLTLQTYVQRIPRDEAFIANLERELVLFLAEADAMIASLLAKSTQEN